MGFAMAWRRRWVLLGVLVPVLVPASLILLALRLLAAPEDVAVVNGELVASVPEDLLGFVYILIGGGAWLLGIASGVIAIGLSSLGTREALKRAAKALPLLAVWGVAGFAVVFLAFLIGSELDWFGIVPVVLAGVLLARLSLVLPSTVLDDGPWWEMARGNTWRVVFRIGIGMVGVPLLLGWCVTTVRQPLLEWFPSVVTGAVVYLLELLLLAAVVAGQAGTLFAVYRDLREEEPAPEPEPEHQPAPRRWIAATTVAALALPALTAAALTPAYGPHISLQRNVFDGWVEEIVWNPGQNPVVFSQSTAYSCDNNACTRGELYVGPYSDNLAAVGVASDGARLSVRFSRNPDDYLNVERCTIHCEDFGRLDLPKRVDTYALPQIGIGGGPDGSIWVAVAQQRTKASKLELSLIRCGRKRCDDNPKWVKAGSVDGDLNDETVRSTVHMRFGPGARPVAEFDRGSDTVHIVTCDTAECASASISRGPDAPVTAQPFGAGREQAAVSDHGYFWVGTESAGNETPLRLTIGGPAPRYRRVVLWHCTEPTCRQARRIPLHLTEAPAETFQAPPIRIAVGTDGTVLIAEGRNIVSLRL